jgi:trimethylamine--corrinoid protein Co-methyltransferase
VNVWDYEGARIRPGVRADTVVAARLCDFLPHIDAAIPMVHPSDCPAEAASLFEMADTLLNTSKHTMSAFPGLDDVKAFLDICSLLSDGVSLNVRPIGSVFLCPTSPLQFSSETSQVLAYAVRLGVPILIMAGPAVGGTSPITLAGSLAQINAETLFAIVLTQLLHPGAPVVYGTAPVIMSMRTMHISYGRVENALFNAAFGQLARFYDLPCCGINGQTSGAEPAVRNGMEKMLSYLGAIAGGLNLGQGAGHFGENAISMEQLILDNEIAGLAKQLFRKITVDEERLGLEFMMKVGPGGNYLTSKHTLRFLRAGEHYQSWALDTVTSDLLGEAHESGEEILSKQKTGIDVSKGEAVQGYISEQIQRREAERKQ